MSFNLNNTIGGRLLLKLEKEIKECIVIPNSWLPEEWHDKVRGGRTLARLEQVCDKHEGITSHRKIKALKAENVENYRKQFEENGSFEYNGHTDELQLHRNQMAMVRGMLNSGMIDAEDLLEGGITNNEN
jgi:hypothetical protein